MATPLPFRVQRAFTLLGQGYAFGDVVDVSVLTDTRVRQLEQSGYGLRVAAGTLSDARGKSGDVVGSRPTPATPPVPKAIHEPPGFVEVEDDDDDLAVSPRPVRRAARDKKDAT